MQAGKLPPSALQNVIFRRLSNRRPEVVLRAALGEDSAALNLDGDLAVLSTDPITGAAKNAGWLAVHVSCNDVAANGAEPVAVLLTLMLPVGSSEGMIAEIMADAERAAEEVCVEIVGGHTEITSAVNQPIISATVIGRVRPESLAASAYISAGDFLIATKYAGLEGTAILANDYAEEVRSILGDSLLIEAQGLANRISVVEEARLASKLGAMAMHDVTEGGLLGAAYELAGAASLGFVIEENAIQLHESTKQLAAKLQFDPLRMISSGSLLIASDQPGAIIEALTASGIPAAVVGRFTEERQYRLVRLSGDVEVVTQPESDELWRVLEEMAGRTS